MAYLASRSREMQKAPQTHIVIYHHVPPGQRGARLPPDPRAPLSAGRPPIARSQQSGERNERTKHQNASA